MLIQAPMMAALRPPPNWKYVKAQPVRCLRLEEHDNFETSQEALHLSKVEPEAKQKDIWRLFKEAQQNILNLNKQRLAAVEELDKLNQEKDELLDRIGQLEAENQHGNRKDKLSLSWELLLRVDSMIINGFINSEEASDLRRLIIDQRKTGIVEFFPEILQKRDDEILTELRQFSDKSKRNGYHIIHICTEMVPLVSVGPLALYVTELSRALQGKGHLVEVILPKYSSLQLDEVQGLREIESDAYSYFNGQLHGNRIWTGVVCGIGVTFIQPLSYSSFFNREKVYGYSDDFDRFAYFSRASLDYIVKSGKRPDVLHIHRWETSIVGPLFWDIFVKQGLEGTRICLTCHGFESQCLVPPEKLALCGLDPARLHRPDRLQDNAKPQFANVLKGGIVYSNKVVMMSSMHSTERIINSLSHGLEPTLAIHKDKLLLAPIGLDNSIWDPSRDKFLPDNYSAENMKGKSICKIALQRQLGLTEHVSTIIKLGLVQLCNAHCLIVASLGADKSVAVGCIFLEASDVDMENLKAIVRNTFRTDIQFIFMGAGMEQIEIRQQEKIKERNLKFVHGYDEALSHLIFAGSDIMLCGSFSGPVLQIPLKALRYGAAPVALTPSNDLLGRFGVDDQESTGFSQFVSSTFGNMSLSNALDEIKNNPREWNQKIIQGMAKDLSWDAECCDIHVSAYTAIKNF